MPVNAHLPLKKVSKKIDKNIIIEKTKLINIFFNKHIKKKAKIAITGLNPHCESTDAFNEDEKIVKPTIKFLKKLNYRIYGPFGA